MSAKKGTYRQKDKRQEAKKFKEYAPGFLHIDITYLPKLNDKRMFLFVGIDRTTRIMFYGEYSRRNAINSADFLKQCINFLPFQIKYVLTDNGLEFTNRFCKKRRVTKNPSLLDQLCSAGGYQASPHKTLHTQNQRDDGCANGIVKTNTIYARKYSDADGMSKGDSSLHPKKRTTL